jgi:hypothetical protein
MMHSWFDLTHVSHGGMPLHYNRYHALSLLKEVGGAHTFSLCALHARHAELTFLRVFCLLSAVLEPCVVDGPCISGVLEDMPTTRGSVAQTAMGHGFRQPK